MNLKYNILIFAVLAFFSAEAQSTRRDTIRPQRDVEVIRFGSDTKTTKKSKAASKRSKDRGIIKTAPFSFVLGYVPVLYEYRVKDWLSVQGGVGVTFKPSISNLQAIIFEELSGCQYAADCSNYRDYSYRKAKLGYLFSFAPKLYFGSDAPEDGYISPEIRVYRQRNKVRPALTDVQNEIIRSTTTYDNEAFWFTDFLVHYGYQVLYPKLTTEWSIGVGLRRVNGKWQHDYYDNTTGYFSSASVKGSETGLLLQVGLRLGLRL